MYLKKVKVIILTLSVIFFGLLLTGCNYYSYNNANQYMAGEATISNDVKYLNIEWVSGDVEIAYHDDDNITFTEKANRHLKSKEVVRYWKNGEVLNIRFAEKGKQNFNNLQKTLTILIPKNNFLESLEIETVSSNVSIDQIIGKSLELETVSGNMNLNNIDFVDCSLSSVSGEINAEMKNGDELDVKTVSGNITLSSYYTEEFSIETVSGQIELSLNAHENTESWDGEIETVSGNVIVLLPADTEFVLNLKNVSGVFLNDFSCTQKNNQYIHISNKNSFSIDSVSGNVSIEKSL